jgi:ribosomal protein L24
MTDIKVGDYVLILTPKRFGTIGEVRKIQPREAFSVVVQQGYNILYYYPNEVQKVTKIDNPEHFI